MKTGLSILNHRSSNQLIDLNFVENQLIPESFRIFTKIYELEYDMLNYSKVKINGQMEFFVSLSMFDNMMINNESYTATIDYVFNFPELNKEYNCYINKTDLWNELGFMKIGLLFHGDVLLLGLSDDKYGEIWRYGSGLINTQFCKLDNNIFEFFSRLREKIDEDQLKYLQISEESLYKSWNEDFWRVRQDA
jgi:hypothetical protein